MRGVGHDDDHAPAVLDAIPDPLAAADLVLADAGEAAGEPDPAVAVDVLRVDAELVVGALAGIAVGCAEVAPGLRRRPVLREDGPGGVRRIAVERSRRCVSREWSARL